jgi:rod shape-determining protein MreD
MRRLSREFVISESCLTIPFAALMALLAALIETTVLPEIPIAGATADLVLVVSVTATLLLGIEDGLVAAFAGGLLIDMLIPDRPLGAGTLSLLLVVGIAAAVARVAGPSRRWLAVALTVVLTPVLHLALSVILVLTEGAPLAIDPTAMLVAAFMNGVVAFVITALFGAIQQRFGTAERVDW